MSAPELHGEARERREYINGLRAFANLLENVSDLPLPTHGGAQPWTALDWLLQNHGDEQKETAARVIRSIPGGWEKDSLGDELFTATGRLAGLHFRVVLKRDLVCTRTVVGTKTVEKKIPVEFKTETVQEEIVEWDCGSLLSPELPNRQPAAVKA